VSTLSEALLFRGYGLSGTALLCEAVIGRREGQPVLCGKSAWRSYTGTDGRQHAFCKQSTHAASVVGAHPQRAGTQRREGA
jgi:hypothetical protein